MERLEATTPEYRQIESWRKKKTSVGTKLSTRVEQVLEAPCHAEVYKENGIGAVIGYAKYMAIVIIDERAIKCLSNALSQAPGD